MLALRISNWATDSTGGAVAKSNFCEVFQLQFIHYFTSSDKEIKYLTEAKHETNSIFIMFTGTWV